VIQQKQTTVRDTNQTRGTPFSSILGRWRVQLLYCSAS